ARERKQLDQKMLDYDRRLKAYNTTRAQRVMGPVVERLKQMGYKPNVLEGTGYLSLKVKPAIIRQMEDWTEVRQISRDRIAEPNAPPRRSGAAMVMPLDVARPTSCIPLSCATSVAI